MSQGMNELALDTVAAEINKLAFLGSWLNGSDKKNDYLEHRKKGS